MIATYNMKMPKVNFTIPGCNFNENFDPKYPPIINAERAYLGL